MDVKILSEYGYEEALFGLGLSYGKTSGIEIKDLVSNDDLFQSMKKVSTSLSGLGNGHNKFLRMITVYLDINAPLYWWKQFDTYKIGTVAQSESTMHTLMKTPITENCFENGSIIYKSTLDILEAHRQDKLFSCVNNNLPQSYLQRRIVSCNYEVLNTIIKQRYKHKIELWKLFCDTIINTCSYPFLISYKNE